YIRLPASPYGLGRNRSPVCPARPRYPRASPAPPSHSSPTTPSGTGSSTSSSTYPRTFHTGRPIATRSRSSSAHSCQVALIVASVGPYTFATRTPTRLASSPLSSSPPLTTSRSDPPPSPPPDRKSVVQGT